MLQQTCSFHPAEVSICLFQHRVEVRRRASRTLWNWNQRSEILVKSGKSHLNESTGTDSSWYFHGEVFGERKVVYFFFNSNSERKFWSDFAPKCLQNPWKVILNIGLSLIVVQHFPILKWKNCEYRRTYVCKCLYKWTDELESTLILS